MIGSESEYQEAVRRQREERDRLAQHCVRLAERLGIHESQLSRDERNENHGITVERATRVLDALNVQLRSHFVEPVLPPSAAAE